MQRKSRRILTRSGGLVAAIAVAYGGFAQGAEDQTARHEKELRDRIMEQTKRLEELKKLIAAEEAKLAEIRRVLDADILGKTRAGSAPGSGGAEPQPAQVAQAQPPAQVAPIGEPPKRTSEGRPPPIAQIFEQPGVLTPVGKMVLEPGMQYAYASSNRVALIGYTIIPALTIGLIDVREVKRNTFTAALTGRWGITNRMEIEAKVPYVYRSDSVLERPLASGSGQDQLFESTGKGIGDVEVTGRYQLNDGGVDKPYYIGTLRFKSRTGKDPFEVLTAAQNVGGSRTTNELQRELPTGSGFYTLQPGLTVLYASDPAVLFGSISYQYNFKRSNVSLNTTNGPLALGDVQAGGILGFNFGMGLALNDRTSLSIGYDHASVGKTKINGNEALNSVRTQIGTLLLGASYRLSDRSSLNVSVGVGATRDTPDIQLSVRTPMTF